MRHSLLSAWRLCSNSNCMALAPHPPAPPRTFHVKVDPAQRVHVDHRLVGGHQGGQVGDDLRARGGGGAGTGGEWMRVWCEGAGEGAAAGGYERYSSARSCIQCCCCTYLRQLLARRAAERHNHVATSQAQRANLWAGRGTHALMSIFEACRAPVRSPHPHSHPPPRTWSR